MFGISDAEGMELAAVELNGYYELYLVDSAQVPDITDEYWLAGSTSDPNWWYSFVQEWNIMSGGLYGLYIPITEYTDQYPQSWVHALQDDAGLVSLMRMRKISAGWFTQCLDDCAELGSPILLVGGLVTDTLSAPFEEGGTQRFQYWFELYVYSWQLIPNPLSNPTPTPTQTADEFARAMSKRAVRSPGGGDDACSAGSGLLPELSLEACWYDMLFTETGQPVTVGEPSSSKSDDAEFVHTDPGPTERGAACVDAYKNCLQNSHTAYDNDIDACDSQARLLTYAGWGCFALLFIPVRGAAEAATLACAIGGMTGARDNYARCRSTAARNFDQRNANCAFAYQQCCGEEGTLCPVW